MSNAVVADLERILGGGGGSGDEAATPTAAGAGAAAATGAPPPSGSQQLALSQPRPASSHTAATSAAESATTALDTPKSQHAADKKRRTSAGASSAGSSHTSRSSLESLGGNLTGDPATIARRLRRRELREFKRKAKLRREKLQKSKKYNKKLRKKKPWRFVDDDPNDEVRAWLLLLRTMDAIADTPNTLPARNPWYLVCVQLPTFKLPERQVPKRRYAPEEELRRVLKAHWLPRRKQDRKPFRERFFKQRFFDKRDAIPEMKEIVVLKVHNQSSSQNKTTAPSAMLVCNQNELRVCVCACAWALSRTWTSGFGQSMRSQSRHARQAQSLPGICLWCHHHTS